MRLIYIFTMEIREYEGGDIPPYAILASSINTSSFLVNLTDIQNCSRTHGEKKRYLSVISRQEEGRLWKAIRKLLAAASKQHLMVSRL